MARYIPTDQDIFELLAREHRAIRGLFEKVEAVLGGPDRTRLADAFCRLAEMLYAHGRAEEQVFYPYLAEMDEDLADLVPAARAAHADVLSQLEELGALPPEDPQWKVRLGTLRTAVETHVAEEEGDLFDLAGDAVDARAAVRLAREFERMRRDLLDEADDLGLGELHASAP